MSKDSTLYHKSGLVFLVSFIAAVALFACVSPRKTQTPELQTPSASQNLTPPATAVPNQTTGIPTPVIPNQITQNQSPGQQSPQVVPNVTVPNQTPIQPPPAAPNVMAVTLNIASNTGGRYLVDGKGMTLYYTISDRPNFSNLPDETLTSWPVFYTANVVVPASLNAADFGTYTRDNKVKQTTYKGRPLYYFYLDKIPGSTAGDKLGNVWFVVNP